MTSKPIRPILMTVFSLFLVGCAFVATTFSITVPYNVESDFHCSTAMSYTYEKKYVGHYKSYRTEIHSQVELDVEDMLSANDVSQLAKMVNDRAVFPMEHNERWRKKALRSLLSFNHVVVAANEENLQNLWSEHVDFSLNARVTLAKKVCFQRTGNTYFMSVRQGRFEKEDPATVVHEMMHVVAWAQGHRDGDAGHIDTSLWMKLDKEKSLQARVLKAWHKKRADED